MNVRDIDFRDLKFSFKEGIPIDYETPAVFLKDDVEEGHPKILWTEGTDVGEKGTLSIKFSNKIYNNSNEPMDVAGYILDLVRYKMITNVMTKGRPMDWPIKVYYSEEYEPVVDLLKRNMEDKGMTIKRELFVGHVEDPFDFLSPGPLEISADKERINEFYKKYNDVRRKLLYLGKEVYGERFFMPPFVAFDHEKDAYFSVAFGIIGMPIHEEIEKTKFSDSNVDGIVSEFDSILWSQHPSIPLLKNSSNRLMNPAYVVMTKKSEKNDAVLDKLSDIGYHITNFDMPQDKDVQEFLENNMHLKKMYQL